MVAAKGLFERQAFPHHETLFQRTAEQVHEQIDRRPALGYIVLQEGVQALVAAVELGRGAQQQNMTVEQRQAETVR